MKFSSSRLAAWTLTFGLLAPGYASPLSGKQAQDGIGIEIGAIAQGGGSELAANNAGLSPMAHGLVLRDHNGLSSRMVIGLVIAIAGALAQSGPKSVERRSYVSGDYIVTETKTTYYSEAEKAQMRENTSKAIDGVFSTKLADMELQLYSRDRFGVGDSTGYKINFLIGSGDSISFESGFGFGVVDSIVDNAGTPTKVSYRYFGMPLRVSAVTGPARLSLTYDWNWLKYGIEDGQRVVHMDDQGNAVIRTASHPWKLEASTVAFGRISLRAGVTAQQIKKPGDLGYLVQAGVLF